MPPLALALLLNRVLPWLSVDGRAVINTLICDNGRVGSVQALCRRLGLRSRFQLNRLLRREGLPPYEELAGWVCVFYWMLRADAEEREGRGALRTLAAHAHMDAASCYRLVRRVTGRCWSMLRDAGTSAAVAQFVSRTHPPIPAQDGFSARRRVRDVASLDSARPTDQPAALDHSAPDMPSRLPLDGSPYAIAVRGHDLAYITRPHGAAVERLHLPTGRFAGTIPLGCTPTCVAFDPSGTMAYVSVQYCDEVAVIDTTQHCQSRALRVSGDPYAVLVSSSGRTLFVTTNEDRLVSLCPANGRVFASLRLPATSHHLALHPAGGRLYVATRTGGSVLEVDTTRCAVLRSFNLGGWPQGMVIAPDGMLLYCANEQHRLDVVHLGTGKRVATRELEGSPVSLTLSPDGRSLYTGFVHEGKVGMISTAAFAVSTIETGGRPREIAFDVRNNRVMVVNEAGWIDLLPMTGRDVYPFQTPQPQPPPRVALSVS